MHIDPHLIIMCLKVEDMRFKDYVFYKNPIGSSVRVRHFILKYNLDENSNLNNLGIGKKTRASINKLQIKFKNKGV